MGAERLFATVGGVLALTGVAAGAFGAHALRARLTEPALAVFETAVRYQMYHALGLIAVAVLIARLPSPLLTWSGWLFSGGTVIFSGSLYLLTLTGARWWGAVTPIGGVCFLAGWGCFVWAVAAAR